MGISSVPAYMSLRKILYIFFFLHMVRQFIIKKENIEKGYKTMKDYLVTTANNLPALFDKLKKEAA